MSEQEQERTEQATPKKRLDERKKGNVALSQDVAAAASLLVATSVILSTAKSSATSAADSMRSAFADGFILQSESLNLAAEFSNVIFFVLQKLGGLFLMIVLTVVATTLLQTRLLFLPKKAIPNFTRLNPARNLKRLFSAASLTRALSGLLKATLFATLIAMAIKRDLPTLASLPFGAPVEIVLFFFKFVSRVAYQFCALAIFIAVADYGYRRWKYERDIRMTRQELLDEIREESGSPQAKGRRRETRSAIMNSVGAITDAQPPRPVSSFRRQRDERKKPDKD